MLGRNIDQQLDIAETAIEGVLEHPEIQKILDSCGYNHKRMLEGKTLLMNARMLQSDKNHLKGTQRDVSNKLQDDYQLAWKTYVRHVTMARLSLDKTSGAYKKLQLSGERKRTYAGWLEQARNFYHELNKEAILLTQIDLTPEEVTQAQAMIEAVRAARREHKQSLGAAKEATKERNQALTALNTWMRRFLKMASVVLEGQTEMLETLGMSVKA